MNIHTEIRDKYNQYIDETENLPEHIKPQAKDIIRRNIQSISMSLGALELLWRRENQEVNDGEGS